MSILGLGLLAGCASHVANQDGSISNSFSNIFQSSTASSSVTTTNNDTSTLAPPTGLTHSETPGVAFGGNIRANMDNVDLSKLSRAMDKSPGRSTHWENAARGVKYTVTPVKRVTVNGNKFCRSYSLIEERGSHQRSADGVACVGDDTNWKDVSSDVAS